MSDSEKSIDELFQDATQVLRPQVRQLIEDIIEPFSEGYENIHYRQLKITDVETGEFVVIPFPIKYKYNYKKRQEARSRLIKLIETKCNLEG